MLMKLCMCFLVLSLIFISCDAQYPNINKTVFKSHYTFIDSSYVIDCNKYLLASKISFIEEKGGDILIFGCLLNSTFYFYNLKSKKIDTVRFIANGHSRRFTDLYAINRDTILIMSNIPYMIHLMNDKGSVYDTLDFRFVNNLQKYAPAPYAKSCNPVFFFQSNFCFAGYRGGEYEDESYNNRHLFIFYNPLNNITELNIPYPEIYKDNNWAGLEFRRIFNAYNNKTHDLILSLPACHNVLVYNLLIKTTKSFEAGSKFVTEIPAFRKSKEWFGMLAKQDYTSFYYNTPS